MLTTALALLTPALAPLPRSGGGIDPGCRCTRTAYMGVRADRHEAREDFLRELGNCVNLADPGDVTECLLEAFEGYSEALGEAEEVLEARVGLCALLGEDPYDPEIDPDAFVDGIDNPFMPLDPGTTRIYEKTTDEGLEHVEVTVLDETKEIDGVECTIVRDTVALDGVLVEDTFDWFAQDEDGNVWYFGEIAFNYEDGEIVDIEGSWTAGEDHAKPGIVMPASPVPGETYRQEWAFGEAEDAATVLATDAMASVPWGMFTSCVQTEDFTPLEPDALEHKFYAAGIGVVLEVDVESGERLELIEVIDG